MCKAKTPSPHLIKPTEVAEESFSLCSEILPSLPPEIQILNIKMKIRIILTKKN